MSRRFNPQEPEFGSDSFLDIIANVVGILIILIVLAGLRASKSATIDTEAIANSQPPTAETPASADLDGGGDGFAVEPDNESIKAVGQVATPLLDTPLPELPTHVPIRYASEAELAQFESVKSHIGRLHRGLAAEDIDAAQAALEQAKRERERASQQLTLLESAREQSLTRKQELDQQGISDAAGLANLQRRLDQVNHQLTTLANQRPEREQLTHRITPVGQAVDGSELHFRLSKDRVSKVPIDGLIEEVKEKLQNSGVWISNFDRQEGRVGPLEGYTLKYGVERVAVNSLDGFNGRGSSTMIRLSVTEFTIEPTSGLKEESVRDALARGGSIIRAIQENPPDATLTIWVYPESFGSYRTIAEFAQRNGIKIAGRPLPKGMPISGSPNGSQSVGQ